MIGESNRSRTGEGGAILEVVFSVEFEFGVLYTIRKRQGAEITLSNIVKIFHACGTRLSPECVGGVGRLGRG